ncbi:hypothetical protein ACFQW4_06645 [Pantoea sp. GCM10028869]|uniref:hypothetical protein n=1 Tax=Pantoea sp. GCM10028869 TaxID=3273417 RepID=UPI003609C2CF
MSKYRKGIAYLRPMKKGDKSDSFMVSIKMAALTTPNLWKHPEHIRPWVMVQHGVKGVAAAFMNREEALRSVMFHATPRARNPKHNRKRGLRRTKGDLNKAFRKFRFEDARGGDHA